MGWRGRGGGRSGPWPGRGPFNYLPPWQRPEWLYGYGRGAGYSYWRGRGYIGRGYGSYSPYVCQRFPWLPRWWWANPNLETSPIYTPSPDPSAELKRLEAEKEALMRDIETMKKHVAEGTTPETWPSTPYGPAMFPTTSPEQEKMFLEQQQNAIRVQMEAIKKRLEELGKEE
jgi:hypothetical protein